MHLLEYHPEEHPVALQLGGSDPAELAQAARLGFEAGYDEINLNCGCPSDRVQSGRFGACLMLEPELVRDCLTAMREAAGGTVPVTVKHRLGVDDQDPREALFRFVDVVAASGVTTFIVHARKAWLAGLSPKQNREVPPLDHALVADLKRERPRLEVVLNGGIRDLDQACASLAHVDGVMLGRAAYQTPWVLAAADTRVYGEHRDPVPDRVQAVRAMRPYVEDQLARGERLHAITRHWLGLFKGRPRARLWRQRLTQGAIRPGAGWDVVETALAAVTPADDPE